MFIVETPWKLTFVASLALLITGCSADNGSSPGAGGNNSGAGGSTAAGIGGSSGNNVGGTAGNGGNVSSDYQPVSATSSSPQKYTLQMGPIKLVIDGATGARIIEFSYNGTNIFTGPDVNPSNYGSTFWPSPQSSWCAAGGGCWPPIAAIDIQAYTGSIDTATNSIQMTSPTALLGSVANSQFTITKQFTPIPASGAIDITYTIKNVSSSVSITVAPWEVSRVKGTGGMTFFGKGNNDPSFPNGRDQNNFVVTEAGDILWYKYAPVTTNSKCFADGVGWIAHVTASNILFLLTYPDIQPSDAASGEAEVELYTGKTDGDYVEIEPQGALTAIAPGATLQWTVRWKLRQVPNGTAVDVGSADLAAFTTQQKNQ